MRPNWMLYTAAASLLLAGWAARHWTTGGGYVLQVPATYLSVGQQFQPELINAAGKGAEETAGLGLWDASGRRIASQSLDLTGSTAAAAPMALPRPGVYQLRLTLPTGTQTIALRALPEPGSDYGGIAEIAAWGVPEGAADYLRQHGFAVTAFGAAPSDGPSPGNSPGNAIGEVQLLLVGDPRLDGGGDLAAAYAQLWRSVGAGAQALLLEPPPPGVAAYWPLTAPLRSAAAGCDADLDAPRLTDGLDPDAGLATLLHPALAFDLGAASQFDLYSWDGTRWPRSDPRRGYAGCHALFSFRYGDGWVTVSTVPLLAHFQDVRARVYLMNLIAAALRRKHPAPASPGLEWVTAQRLEALAKSAPQPLVSEAAVFYWPPPDAVAAAEQMLPEVNAAPASCWTSPPGAQSGAVLRLDYPRPLPARSLKLNFGPTAGPAQFTLEASLDGMHWTPLPHPAASTALSIPLPSSSTAWQAFRLTLTVPQAGPWRLCQFIASP